MARSAAVPRLPVAETSTVPPWNATLKAVFISAKLTFDLAVVVTAGLALWRGAGPAWLGPLAATLPFLALL